MDKKDYFVIRNSDGADKWDKPIVVATNIEEYYIMVKELSLYTVSSLEKIMAKTLDIP